MSPHSPADEGPKTLKIRVRVSTNNVGSKVEDVIDTGLDMTEGYNEKDIDNVAVEWMWNNIDFNWEPVDE